MSRSQKKCLIVSAALHLGLLSSVVLLSAFRPPATQSLEFQPIDFTPVVTTFDNMSGGGNPNGQTLQLPPPPPPPRAQKPPEPAPREIVRETVREPQPKVEEDSLTPSTRPTRKKPQIDLSNVVTRPRHETKKVKPKQNDEDTEANDRELANAAADARRRWAKQIGQVASQIGGSRSGPVSIELKGPGGGGLPYANFFDAVLSLYKQEWIIPDGASETDATTVAEIRIARDGKVLSATITRRSGSAVVDQSVQLTLDRVRQVPPLPPNSEEDTVTMKINFKATPETRRTL
jgi:TonB family protein